MPLSRLRRAPLLLLAIPALGCKGAPPEQVRLELPERILSQDPARATVHVRRGGASSVTKEQAVFTVSPPDLAEVTRDGTVTCRKTGDAKVLVNVQGVKDEAALHCRLVERIDMGELSVFDLNQPPVVVTPHALSKTGVALDDVPVTLRSESPRVLAVAGSTLTPLAVGTTTITAAAGNKEQKIPVRVVRSVTAEALPLEGGRRIYYSLPAGKYEVEVTLLIDKELGVEWRGAPYCSYKGRGRTHRSTCVLQNKGGAVVDNPAYLTAGDTTVTRTGIVIREVP